MSATINAFPAVHAFNSSRSWAIALIALIHVGFFLALTSGLAHRILPLPLPRTQIVLPPEPTRPPDTTPQVQEPTISRVYIPDTPMPDVVDPPSDTAPRVVTHERRDPLVHEDMTPPRAVPVEIAPQIDPRRGLSEPLYPPALIRQGIEGTVVLSVQVMENGRVGDVRVEVSSGFAKLDEAAVREARRWRLIAGTRDGVPVVLWKQIPIRFRLQDAR